MPLCLVFPFITIKGLLFLFYSRLTRRLQRFRWNTGTCLTFTTKHSALLYCLILGDNAGEDGGIITAHVLNKKKRCGITEELPALFFSPPLTPSFHVYSSSASGDITSGSAEVRGHRPKAEGRKTELIFITQMPAASDWRKKKSEAINLLSWTWCVGYLTRMFSAFNYSPKSPSPTRIKSYFKVKWRRCRDRGHAADNGQRRLQQERLFFFRRAHQSGTRRSFLVCRPQQQFHS